MSAHIRLSLHRLPDLQFLLLTEAHTAVPKGAMEDRCTAKQLCRGKGRSRLYAMAKLVC